MLKKISTVAHSISKILSQSGFLLIGLCTGTQKYIKKGLSKNTRYTKYRTIGFIRIHDDTRRFRQYTNIEVNE